MRPVDGELGLRDLTTADDLDAFGRIVVGSYLALPGTSLSEEYVAELADVATRVREGRVIGAFLDGVPAGCVTFVEDASSPFAESLLPGESSFRMLAVDESAQGRGVGEALAGRCLDEAVRAGSSAVFILSATWMHAAHRLYERLGFEFVPDRDWFYPGIHLLALHRSL